MYASQAFYECFEVLTEDADLQPADRDQLNFAKGRLYDLFDSDSDGSVDFVELSTGLSILCGGDPHAKVW